MKTALRLLKQLKFRQKLFLSYILIALLPSVILGTYSYNQAREILVVQEKRNLAESVEKAAVSLDYRFNKYNSVMEFVIMNPRVIDIFSTKYTDMYQMYKDISGSIVPMMHTIQGLDADIAEMAVCTTNDFPELSGSIKSMSSVVGEFWTQAEIKNTQTRWTIGQDKLVGARRMMEPIDSRIENILYLEVDYAKMIQAVNPVSAPYVLLLFDNEGHQIYSRGSVQTGQLDLEDRQGGEVRINGVGYLRMTAYLPSAQWTMQVLVPVRAVTVDAGKIIEATIMVSSACMLALLLLVWMFSGAFFRRIQRLNQKIRLVAAGDLGVRIQSEDRDEIGDLTNGFGAMLKSVNRLMAEASERQNKQREAEIKLLQARIKPHFLYNSLSLINWTAIDIGSWKISEVTTSLSRYYRTMLNNGRSLIRVRDEMDNIAAYIRIQLAMHEDSFDVEYDVDDEALNGLMPNFSLQPIVENAIEHGVDVKESGRGRIVIRATVQEECIAVTIADNGPGIPAEKLGQLLAQSCHGYGLFNVHERIRLTFGDRYGIVIESDRERGTLVRVTVPKEWREEETDSDG